MNGSDVMMGLCVGGIALSLLYCFAEWRHWVLLRAADRKTERSMRALYARLFSVQSIQRAARDLVVRPLTTLTGRKGKEKR
jgi:hypothetical protein